ncbi:hypothetical protein IDM40_15745 [Nocardiopsis sp. HNM0947]|uniref:Uncharacterized protein n=1 Tax=Nocardiopsis coralli TaxID=2772213 RepID=A0ABR9P8G3_9ACTN|nr:hypothetical protein [Nocardiopsis coralli]
MLSPERDEAVFMSTAESGEASWYWVPTDGSDEPTEIGPVSEESEGGVPISWT